MENYIWKSAAMVCARGGDIGGYVVVLVGLHNVTA